MLNPKLDELEQPLSNSSSTPLLDTSEVEESYYQKPARELVQIINEGGLEAPLAWRSLVKKYNYDFVPEDLDLNKFLDTHLESRDPKALSCDELFMELRLRYRISCRYVPRKNVIAEVYRRAIQQDPFAIFIQGWMNYKGVGVNTDKSLAEKKYSQAANLGHPLAQLKIAKLLYYSDSNLEQVNKWINKAVEQGVMAVYYFMNKYRIQSYYHLLLAALAGHGKSIRKFNHSVTAGVDTEGLAEERKILDSYIPMIKSIQNAIDELKTMTLWSLLPSVSLSDLITLKDDGQSLKSAVLAINLVDYVLQNITSPLFGLNVYVDTHMFENGSSSFFKNGQSYSDRGYMFIKLHNITYVYFISNRNIIDAIYNNFRTKDPVTLKFKNLFAEYSQIIAILNGFKSKKDADSYIQGFLAAVAPQGNGSYNLQYLVFSHYAKIPTEEGCQSFLTRAAVDLSILKNIIDQTQNWPEQVHLLIEKLASYRTKLLYDSLNQHL